MEYLNKKGEKKNVNIKYGGLFAVKAKSKEAYKTFNKYYKIAMKLAVSGDDSDFEKAIDDVDALDAADIIYAAYICCGYTGDYKRFCEEEINDDFIYNAEKAVDLIVGDVEKNASSAKPSNGRRGKANRK